MLQKILVATAPFRRTFGILRGTLLWAEMLKEHFRKAGTVFSVHVPNIRHPVWLRAKSSDIEVFLQIFIYREFAFLNSDPKSYIIDAGANIGLTSVLFANMYPEAAIDALEIDKGNLEVLERNARPYRNINIIPCGLWSRTASLKIINPEAKAWAFRVEETTESDPSAIPAVGIIELLSRRRRQSIDILKIDIEGSECEVLGSDSAQWMKRVNLLAIELHDRYRKGCSEALELATAGLNCIKRRHGEYHILEFSQTVELAGTQE